MVHSFLRSFGAPRDVLNLFNLEERGVKSDFSHFYAPLFEIEFIQYRSGIKTASRCLATPGQLFTGKGRQPKIAGFENRRFSTSNTPVLTPLILGSQRADFVGPGSLKIEGSLRTGENFSNFSKFGKISKI